MLVNKLVGVSSVAFENHVKDVVSMLNKVLLPYKIKVSIPKDIARNVPGNIRKSFTDGRSVKGSVYPNHVECLAEILRTLMYLDTTDSTWHYRVRRICVEALTQSGKTGLIIACSFLQVIVTMLTDCRTKLIIRRFLLTASELEKQADEECLNFSNMYRHLEFKRQGESLSLYEYIEAIKTNVSPDSESNIPADMPVTGFSYRHTPTLVPDAIGLTQSLLQNGLTPINVADEIQARIRCEKGSKHALRDMVSPEDSLEFSPEHTFIGVSATPHVLKFLNEEDGEPNLSFLPGGVVFDEDKADKSKLIYTGWGWSNGRKIYNLNIPVVKSFKEIEAESGSGIGAYAGDIRKHINKNPAPVSHALAKMFKYLFVNRPDSKGMLIRMHNNTPTKDMVKRLKVLMPGIVIWSHTPEADEKLTLEKACEERCGPPHNRKPYIVFVTGRARCGSVAPSDCRIGMDFAKSSEPQVNVQGIPGRMTGYDKGIPLIIMSETNASILNRHIETGKWQKRNAAGEWKDISTYRHFIAVAHRSETYSVPRLNMSQKLAQDLEKLVNEIANIRNDRIGRPKTLEVIPVALMEEVIKIAESHGRVIDRKFLKYAKNGMVSVQVRRSNEKGGSQGGTRKSRCQESGIRSDPVLRVEPDLVGGKFVFHSVKLITADQEVISTTIHEDRTAFANRNNRQDQDEGDE